jgi:aminoglycoside/choline kinase family phosphotransferase
MDESTLARWLSEIDRELESCRWLAGDVSPRRYARLELVGGESAIAAIYPPELGDACSRFERSTGLLESIGVRVPRVLASDCGEGWMLVEDLGAETLFDRRSRAVEERLPLYESAIEAARLIGTLDIDTVARLNPPLDAPLLRRELRQSFELYLEPHGLLGADAATRDAATGALRTLCDVLGGVTPLPCHRDFMARNLVPCDEGVAVLDHQDLRLGPPAYDLASLLNDSFFPDATAEGGLLSAASLSTEERAFYHRAALQRTLKAIGTFAAFARRGSVRHLSLIAPTLERARLQLSKVPEMGEVAGALEPVWARHIASLAAGDQPR